MWLANKRLLLHHMRVKIHSQNKNVFVLRFFLSSKSCNSLNYLLSLLTLCSSFLPTKSAYVFRLPTISLATFVYVFGSSRFVA